MSEHNKAIQEFLDTACNQIRYKSIHKSIIDELTDHIEEQKIQYIKEGYSQEEATAKAIEQMGDPVLVGKELDKAHRPKTEWSILSLVAILVLIGAAVQFIIFGENPRGPESFPQFLMYVSVGLVAFTFTYFILNCFTFDNLEYSIISSSTNFLNIALILLISIFVETKFTS